MIHQLKVKQKVTTHPSSRAPRGISMMLHGAHDREIPRGARDDVRCEQLQQKNISLQLLGVVLLITVSTLGYALESDKEQMVHVTADTANLSQKNHIGSYNGHVSFIQGTSNLEADAAITEANKKNQLSLAVAHGSKKKQAHYWTQTAPDKPPFHAYADTIKYYPLEHKVELIGKAHIEQGPNSLAAAKIIYDVLEQHVVTESDGSMRTTIIIYPEKKSS